MTKLERAQNQRKLAEEQLRKTEVELSTELAKHRLARVKGEYDLVDDKAHHRRKAGKIETQSELDILYTSKQLKAINLSRNLIRNFTAAKSIDWQLRVNVVGTGPKIKLKTDDTEANKAGQAAFNLWSRTCDSRDDTPWPEILGCILSSVGTDGGTLLVFDDFDRNDGKLLFYSIDQMVTINQVDWKQNAEAVWREDVPTADGKTINQPMAQERGFIRDYRGRIVAYVVTAKPGRIEAKKDECTIYPVKQAKLVKDPWRLNQVLPIPGYAPMVCDMEDAYETRLSEIQTLKKLAKIYASVTSMAHEEMTLGNTGVVDDLSTGGGVAPNAMRDALTGAESTTHKKNYDSLEALTGGYNDYLEDGDKVEIHNAVRQSDNITPFLQSLIHGGGASVGVARCYTDLQAETSYTAFRGEMLMSWDTYLVKQKFLERRVCDWTAVKALTWLQKKGLCPKLPAGWETKIAWGWKKMPTIKPETEYKAMADALKVLAIDWEEILGPDWEEKIVDFAKQLDFIRKLNLPISMFETKSGGDAPAAQEQEATNE